MRTNGTLSYILGDHLGSTSMVTDAAGNVLSQQKYKAWGETRYSSGSMSTKYQYTGQFSYASDFGLYFYNARWYDPTLGRFAQADSIIPGGVQGLDRYAYVNNNPLRYTDPTGHMCMDPEANRGAAGCDGADRVGQVSHGGGLGILGRGNTSSSGSENRSNDNIIQIGTEPNWRPLEAPQLNDFLLDDSMPNSDSLQDYMANCEREMLDCIIRPPLVRGHWDWSRIDWKTTGIDSVSFLASLAGLRFASDVVRNIGRGANTGSFANTFYNEYKKRDGNIAGSILNTNTLISFAGYHPVYGAIPSGTSVLNDLSEGYWEEILPVYGPPKP